MKIKDYLAQFNNHTVNLIGPMQNRQKNLPEPIIYVDGGTHFRASTEGFSVGDNDSYNQPLNEELPADKDYSDLAYALSHCKGISTINLYGFLDGRKDHEIINFGEVHHFLTSSPNSKVNFENKIWAFSPGKWPVEFKGIFSTFCFEETTISLYGGIEYQLHKHPLKPFSSHGLSNVSQNSFTVECDKPLFIFLVP